MEIDFIDTIRNLTTTFDTAGIEWAVAGAVAANLYRDQVRATSDLDILLTLTGRSVESVTDALHGSGEWSSINVVEDWLVRAASPDGGRLDVIVTTTDYEKEALAKAKTIDLGDSRSCKTLAVEDVLILKLIADRFQDNADVESILATRPELDWDYMSKWIEVFDLEDRLQRIEDAAIEAGRLTEKLPRTQGRTKDSSSWEL